MRAYVCLPRCLVGTRLATAKELCQRIGCVYKLPIALDLVGAIQVRAWALVTGHVPVRVSGRTTDGLEYIKFARLNKNQPSRIPCPLAQILIAP